MSNESRIFTVLLTVETKECQLTPTTDIYTKEQADAAIIKFHEECAYNRAAENVAYYSCAIVNEFNGVEMSESYRKPVNPLLAALESTEE